MTKQTNIFGDSIEVCCSNPVTGFYRDGFCRTDELDRGLHVVCAQITSLFLVSLVPQPHTSTRVAQE